MTEEITKRISIDSSVQHGAPVIAGTRVPVSIVLGSLAGGMTVEEIEREYAITKEDVEAALTYAAEVVSRTELAPLGT